MSPQGLVVMQQAWNRYVERDVLDVQCVRSEVAESWQRCRHLDIDPFQRQAPIVNPLELDVRLRENQHLTDVARPCMQSLYNFVKGSGFQVILTDGAGFLLEVLGDEEIVARAARVSLCPGGNWNEGVMGTNAIGTAIAGRKPVQIHAWEHYCQPNHFLTCSAAPIFDPDNQLIGVLDISGDCRMANAHTLGMVVASANAIENQLRLQRATNKLYVAFRFSNTLIETMSDGLVSIDNSGLITELNAKGGEILGVSPAAVKGRHIGEIDNIRISLLNVLSDVAEHEEREILIDHSGKKIHTSASLMRDDTGDVIGAVAVFREIRHRAQMAGTTALESHRYSFDDIIGDSPAIRGLKKWARRAAASTSTVLIQGETGTGKELFAQAIHNASPRSNYPFVAINCGAMPENLIESELFGYEEGSFTGAKRSGQAGKFEAANGGSVFLDEIGDMPLAAQMKLLRVLQEKRVVRIGSSVERLVDIRVIAATHKSLNAEVSKGTFRQDLYYRLNVLDVRIPPLRERMEDLPALARHLATKLAAQMHRGPVCLDERFLAHLAAYNWPGNVRELENAIERAVLRADEDGVLSIEPFEDSAPAAPQLASPSPLKSLREMEKSLIAETLASCEGNIQKASARLGICRNTLYRKMSDYGLS